MFLWLRRILVGSPLPNWRAQHERLPKVLALPVFASDALSSVAYATEEIVLVLVLAGTGVILYHDISILIAAGIVTLLAIVATSYRQTIHAYPSGGGSYIVAKDNLGMYPGLIAGSALMIDYTLTVAVSVAAGVAAITSALPQYAHYRVGLCLFFVALIALANLRGVRESGLLFALPTYTFIFSIFVLIGVGLFRMHASGLHVPPPPEHLIPKQLYTGIPLLLVLRAFSSGCTALTGVEAISNGIPAFRPPESKNAATTLTWMAAILGCMFVGISYLAWKGHVLPIEPLTGGHPTKGYETVISQIAHAVFSTPSTRWFYYVIQSATAGILVLAANTSFADFPRLGSIMARDRFLPRQLFNLGDRLVYSNGILLLGLLAGGLIWLFKGDTNSLIPLYAVGVFLSFTLSQAGMVKHARRLRERGWRRSAVISAVGSVTTGIVTLVIAGTKFASGAWIVVLLIPCLVLLFSRIHQHYVELGNELRLTSEDEFQPIKHTVLVLTPSIHRGVLKALEYAQSLAADVRAIHVETDPVDTAIMEDRWEQWGGGIPLVILESQYRSLISPVLDYLEEAKREREDCMITVVIPEFVPKKWWHKALHNQSGLLLKFALLFRQDIVTTNVRYYVRK
jgi:amino acid transporter